MAIALKMENSCFCTILESLENQYTGYYWPAQ